MGGKSGLPNSLQILLPLGLFGLLFALFEYGIQIEIERDKEFQYRQVLQQSTTVRAKIETELNATLYITSGLTGYIAIDPSLDNHEAVDTLLATVFRHGKYLHNLGLAPNNVLSYIYPLQGNEQALGLKYEDMPKQWEAVKRAIQLQRTVLAGPVNLVQGGRGFISRTPVFLEDGRYWGILSLVIDIEPLFRNSGLMNPNSDIEFALRGSDGLGETGEVFFGPKELFEQQPIVLDLFVPGGYWQLAARPKQGWDSQQSNVVKFYHFAGLTISLLISLMVAMILRDRKKINYLALHDPLTGLPNRRLFDERLNYTLAQKERQHKPFSLLYIDLDNFKPINDRYGHKVGDLVLREVAARMVHTVRHEDTVARIGGDEFMIILPSTGDAGNTQHVAEELLEAISKPFEYQNTRIDIHTSIGVSIYPLNGETVESLVRAADQAMYRAKHQGKRQVSFDETRGEIKPEPSENYS